MPPLGHSGHVMVHFTLELQCYETPRHLPDRSESTYVRRKADYEGIANYLYNIDWYHLVCCNPSAEDRMCMESFRSCCLECYVCAKMN